MATLQEMIAAREKIDAEIEQLKGAARADGLQRIHDLMQHHGFTLADIKGATSKTGKPRASKGLSVPAKYTDGTNSWSGRGVTPNWIKNSGKPKEAFAIAAH